MTNALLSAKVLVALMMLAALRSNVIMSVIKPVNQGDVHVQYTVQLVSSKHGCITNKILLNSPPRPPSSNPAEKVSLL